MSDTKQIRVLLTGSLPPPVGGISIFLNDLISSSLHEKVDIRFLETSPNRINANRIGRATIGNVVYTTWVSIKLVWEIIRFHPDIIHISTSFGLSFIKNSLLVIIAHFLRRRIFLHPHCSYLELYKNKHIFWRSFFRFIIGMCDGLIVLSEEWMNLGNDMPNSSIFLMKNAINLQGYQKIAVSRNKESTNTSVLILYLGWIGEAKGSYDLIQAAKYISGRNLNDLYIKLVGDGLFQDQLVAAKTMIQEYNLSNIEICSPISGLDKYKQLEEADIFVYPSHHEGMPIAIIEAMACGLPVVATSVGGIPDLVQNGVNGFLVSSRHPEELAKALIKLSNRRNLRHQMGEEGIRITHQYHDIEQYADRLVNIYEQVKIGKNKNKKHC
jgi:glycosyltransferase involved in cell wall biosynthesis